MPKFLIIVATHKKYKMPQDEMYYPLQMGADITHTDLGYKQDNQGENISSRNPSFCELTGLYWAWKNLHADYLGLVHYRRHFSLQKRKKSFDKVLSLREAENLFQRYKVILPRKQKYYIETLYSHYKHTHHIVTLDTAYEILSEMYPDYVRDYKQAVSHRSGYMFNMFIMPKTLSDEYCEWLFPMLFELENRIGELQLSAYQGRFYGRISEILFNVWIAHQIRTRKFAKKDIKEIPCIYMEKINWHKKCISFLRAKFFHKKYEGSF